MDRKLEEQLRRLRKRRRQRYKNIREEKTRLRGNSEEKQRQYKLERRIRRNALRHSQKDYYRNINEKIRQNRNSPKTKQSIKKSIKKTPTAKSLANTNKKTSNVTGVKKPRKIRSDAGLKRRKRGLSSELSNVSQYQLSKYRRLKEEYLMRIMNGDVDAAFTEQDELLALEKEIQTFKLQFIRSLDGPMIQAFKIYLEKAIEHWFRHPEFQQIFDSLDEFLQYIELA